MMKSSEKFIVLLEEEGSPTSTSYGDGDTDGDDDEENTWIEFLQVRRHFIFAIDTG